MRENSETNYSFDSEKSYLQIRKYAIEEIINRTKSDHVKKEKKKNYI